MFSSLGWGEVLTLIVVALLIFGPDRLPSFVRDTARLLRQLRGMAQGARTQLRSELGPEFADLDFDSLNPRTFVRKHLFEDGDDDPLGLRHMDDPPGSPGSSGATAAGRTPPDAPLRNGEHAPYDPDAT